MSKHTLPKLFHLKRNDEILAVLESCGPSGEMFWLTCNFRPTVSFVQVVSLFREAGKTKDMVYFDQIYDKLLEMGVVLVDVENDIVIKYFYIHIDGNNVNLRYAEPPYLEQ